MISRLLNFFEKHQIVYDYQYSFRKKHSTLHALLDVISEIYNAIQREHHTEFMFMDLRKTFDTLSHKIFLQKLYHYGIREAAHTLIESFFKTIRIL